jgi:hypothetical protein
MPPTRSSLSLLVAALAGSAQAPMLRYQVPEGWTTEQPRSSMRQAQFSLPRAAGDGEDAEAVIFFFGRGQGGSVTANLERWAGQMQVADGRPGTARRRRTGGRPRAC